MQSTEQTELYEAELKKAGEIYLSAEKRVVALQTEEIAEDSSVVVAKWDDSGVRKQLLQEKYWRMS